MARAELAAELLSSAPRRLTGGGGETTLIAVVRIVDTCSLLVAAPVAGHAPVFGLLLSDLDHDRAVIDPPPIGGDPVRHQVLLAQRATGQPDGCRGLRAGV